MEPVVVAAVLAAGLLGLAGWVLLRRRRQREEYRSAHRLLRRLQMVSRQLPVGLDEVSLAQQTLDEIARDVPSARSVLFVAQDDQLVPYAVRGADRSPFPSLTLSSMGASATGRPHSGKESSPAAHSTKRSFPCCSTRSLWASSPCRTAIPPLTPAA